MKGGDSVVTAEEAGGNLEGGKVDLNGVENAEEYLGAENKIKTSRTYDINFICNYHLFW